MAKQELGPNQLKWIEALESGKYRQGRGRLMSQGKYCCLGVGCDIFEIPKIEKPMGFVGFGEAQEEAEAPSELQEILGLRHPIGIWTEFCSDTLYDTFALTTANDRGASFSEIADFCREHPEAIFTEPR